MTPRRQGFHAACFSLAFCLSGALAQAEPAKTPDWLASRPAPKVGAKATGIATGKGALPSGGRLAGLVLVLGSLGALTVYLKRRGGADIKRALPVGKLAVLSSARIGPKAHAVVISVSGRKLLLGVTDSSVERLADLDDLLEESEARDAEPARRSSALQVAAVGVEPRRMAVAASSPARPGSFSDILKTAFGRRSEPVATDAASILAAETQDSAFGKPAPSNVRMLDVEGQAQGLVRRLSGPRA
jgi:flagellar biogenesis protein FliO